MIQTDALSFSYPVEEGQRRTTALDNVTLSIEKGSDDGSIPIGSF